jgi:hypothetical protein|tara:strand:+ start:261 stop:422 length:162 start_codon:yes stop_codon:yes gene_type:complete
MSENFNEKIIQQSINNFESYINTIEKKIKEIIDNYNYYKKMVFYNGELLVGLI